MSAEIESLKKEIESRVQQVAGLKQAEIDTSVLILDLQMLDSNFIKDQNKVKLELETLYTEQKHYTGKNPIVYTQAQTDVYPYFKGPLNTNGNPYYRPEDVIAGTDPGIAPIYSPPNRVGPIGYGRDRTHSPKEDIPRIALSNAISAYPNHVGEPLPANWPNAQESTCVGGIGSDESSCLLDGGTWTPVPDPVWIGSETAPGLLRAATIAWRDDCQVIKADLYHNDPASDLLYQDAVDKCNALIALIPADAVFVRATGNSDPIAWGQTPTADTALQTALDDVAQLTNIDVPNNVTARVDFLDNYVNEQEDLFFGIIKLRLHSINGSFSKVRGIESSIETTAAIIEDHEDSIRSLNRLVISKT